MKKVTIIIGRGRSSHTFDMGIVGVEASERLTPKLARQALRSAGQQVGTVYDTTPLNNRLIGYRVYPNAVRKLPTKDKRTTVPEGKS